MNADLITTAELAEMKGVDRKTATRWCAKGTIPSRRVGRDYLIERRIAIRFKPPKSGRPEKKLAS